MKTILQLLSFTFLFITLQGLAQQQVIMQAKDNTEPWHHKDFDESGIMGISLQQAMELAKENNRKQNRIIVAVIDSGTDTAHYDLKNKLWTNPNEIADNGIDDDKNGYIDDIHGWNFIGNEKGENVEGDRLELTRIYAKYYDEFEYKKKRDIPKSKRDSFEIWQEVKEKYYSQLKEQKTTRKNMVHNIKLMEQAIEILEDHFDKEDFMVEEVENIETDYDRLAVSKSIYLFFMGLDMNLKEMKSYLKNVNKSIDTKYNLDYKPRKIVGDNVYDINDSIYGNNDLQANSPGHGTHCAGIIAADWNNKKGTHGIVQNVEIMTIRVVPGGDERDKDVALAIKYAVKMGAKVINCSFGKDYSPNKQFVDDAYRFADKNDVLIVKAAGNDALDIEKIPHYPSKYYRGSNNYMKNVITVGASTQNVDKNLIASFSNYGNESVDIFAPGLDITSTYPKNKIKDLSGTSMASPVVAGVAALVWSYYPELSASELKNIIINSAEIPEKLKVKHPQKKLFKKKFDKYSVTGGVVNAYNAVKMAEKNANK